MSIHNNRPMPPIRVYYGEKSKILSVFAEFPIPINLIHSLSETLYDFITENGITRIISIGGLPTTAPNGKNVFTVTSDAKSLAEATKAGLRPIPEGVSAGISALLLLKASSSSSGMSAINILIPLDQSIIDPGNAEQAIVALNKLMNLKIDIDALDKEAKLVESKIREMARKSQETHETYKRSVSGAGPSMYA